LPGATRFFRYVFICRGQKKRGPLCRARALTGNQFGPRIRCPCRPVTQLDTVRFRKSEGGGGKFRRHPRLELSFGNPRLCQELKRLCQGSRTAGQDATL